MSSINGARLCRLVQTRSRDSSDYLIPFHRNEISFSASMSFLFSREVKFSRAVTSDSVERTSREFEDPKVQSGERRSENEAHSDSEG